MLKREASKIGIQLVSKPSLTIGSLLCSKAKHHLPKLQESNVVYKIECSCQVDGDPVVYIGETDPMLSTVLGWLGWLASLVFSPVTIGLVVLLLTLIYRYLTRHKNFWKGKGIANKPYRFPMGNVGFDFYKIILFMSIMYLPSFIKNRFDLTSMMLSNDALDFFVDIAKRAIKEREEHPERRRNDYLQLLIDSRSDKSQTRKLTDDEITAQCLLFFFAGNDTTSNSLTWAAREIAFHPEVQERIQAEIDEVLTSDDTPIDFDKVNSGMPYLESVVMETLRMYPGMQLTRASTRDYTIPGTDAVLPANSMVYMMPYAMQRDADLYPNPDSFDPERFLSNGKELRNSYTYLAFGQGPRNCIGMRFALLQAKVALVALLRKYSLVTGPKSGEVKPVLNPGFAQTQEKDGTWLKIVRR
ncbi:Cytochrome P450 3A31 [Amphibalanus amphitrite]|uniref:Cytochrome P450 3A31 n=1 Tax=Amphibalanus amphitrite TaxID=1232801 RepID=A0A6A4X0I3_AMPAM|nr:Cytochrome P450 3A31 [Amphibalanus amphitrite]